MHRDSLLLNPEDVRSEQIAAVRDVCKLIKELPGSARTPEGFAHLCDVLVGELSRAGFSHLDDAVSAGEYLVDAAETLRGIETEVVGIDDSVAWMRGKGML